jgi:hypothetical protein
MNKRVVLLILIVALALGACTGPMIVLAPTPTPTPLPRLTNDADCRANWSDVVKAAKGDDDLARQVLSTALEDRAGNLPGSVGEYLVWCVDEGWRGYFNDAASSSSY